QAGWRRLLDEIARLVGDYHRRHPLRRAMPKEDLRSRLGIEAGLFRRVISRAVEAAVVVEEGAGVRLPGYKVQLTPHQEQKAQRLLQAHREAPYTPPTALVSARDYGVDATSRRYIMPLLEHLDDLTITQRVGDERVLVNRTSL
ncbi:MAG TPA: hypothetical protein EYP55_10850, partial [Anaerolineae bacterium]|nr:hypothetical protein [Anaerolineae bacterium]